MNQKMETMRSWGIKTLVLLHILLQWLLHELMFQKVLEDQGDKKTKPPIRLSDYVTGSQYEDGEDELAQFALFLEWMVQFAFFAGTEPVNFRGGCPK